MVVTDLACSTWSSSPYDRPGAERRVLFYRDFRHFTGGHLKVWHYYEHVRQFPGFRPLIAFSPATRWDQTNPWLAQREQALARWDPNEAEVLFLAGMDWLVLREAERQSPPCPVINLIQHVRHADPGEALYAFLGYPAVRICVSVEVEQALRQSGRVNGPLVTIPNGIDLEKLPPSPPWQSRDLDVLVLGIKQPVLANELAYALGQAGWRVDSLVTPVPRPEFLQRLAHSRTALLLPHPTEGFYLPAVEAMAMGTLVICPDCVGNRSFCMAGRNCVQPPYRGEALLSGVAEALTWAPQRREEVRAQACAMASRHSLLPERQAFSALLSQVAPA